MKYISKDRQKEQVVEKLCQRFRSAGSGVMSGGGARVISSFQLAAMWYCYVVSYRLNIAPLTFPSPSLFSPPRSCKTDQQWRDLAFCISQLSFTDKMIQKLQENFSSFGDKMADEEIYESFQLIVRWSIFHSFNHSTTQSYIQFSIHSNDSMSSLHLSWYPSFRFCLTLVLVLVPLHGSVPIESFPPLSLVQACI